MQNTIPLERIGVSQSLALAFRSSEMHSIALFHSIHIGNGMVFILCMLRVTQNKQIKRKENNNIETET